MLVFPRNQKPRSQGTKNQARLLGDTSELGGHEGTWGTRVVRVSCEPHPSCGDQPSLMNNINQLINGYYSIN